ncbi:hypothetical protein D0Z03_001111 [Geotrichum reessii]|nr:hypothetical protein D0Z03_001111 [Galactomyces reessii]
MFLAFLRNVYPDQNERSFVKFPRVLEQLLLKQAYPPKPMYKNRLITVPKITLSVGRLSANPFVLLQRISKTIQFENPAMFPSEDDFDTLYFLFSDINEIEKRMSPESKRILEEVSKENSIFTDNALFIKDTPELPYDIRARTWSKHYNQAYIDPVTGEPHRPLTNYVYEDSQREMIMKSSSLPKAQRTTLPYPESPTLGNMKDKAIHIGTWDEVMHYYTKALGDKKKLSGETTKNRRITTDNLTTCTLSKVAIDDFFVWVWINSISPEQTEISKAQFGRSIVVELQMSDGEAGRRWVVVEEVLTPAPPPMKPKAKEVPPPAKPKAATPKPKAPKPAEKKPVRFTEPKIVSPVPVKPTIVVHPPEPQKEKTIHFHYDIDPLVAAVAEKLKVQNVDKDTQTDKEVPILAKSRPAVNNPHAISANEGNSKGTQTYEYVDAIVSPPSSPKVNVTTKKRPVSSSSYVSEVQSIYVSPALEPTEPITPIEPILRTSKSYEEVMKSLPYLSTSPSRDADYMVKPILSSDIPDNIFETEYVQASAVEPEVIPENSSSPSNEDLFVPSIDTSFTPSRRVVSMPVNSFAGYGQNRLSSTQQQQQTPRSSLPMIDQMMMMDSGPMPGGLRSNANLFARPTRNSLPPPSSRQAIPTTHHSHSSPEHNSFDYGSDTGYRYDNYERPKDSPDSGFAKPPSLKKQIQNQQHRQRRASMAGHSSSESDVSRSSVRSRSNSIRADIGPAVNNTVNMNPSHNMSSMSMSTNSSGVMGVHNQSAAHQTEYQQPPPQGYAFVKISPEIKAPQPRSGVTPMLFNEPPVDTSDQIPTMSSNASGTSLPRTEPVAVPPVVSAVNVGSQPFGNNGNPNFGDHGSFLSSKLPVIEASPRPLETAFVEKPMSPSSSNFSGSYNDNYRAVSGSVDSSNNSDTNRSTARRTSASFYNKSLPDDSKFDPSNEQSVERIASRLVPPPPPPAPPAPVSAAESSADTTTTKKSSSIRVAQVITSLSKLTKSKFGNKSSESHSN